MYKIVKARRLADKIFLMDVHAPRVASHCQPGQFTVSYTHLTLPTNSLV